jgi:malate dehydrogenase
MKKIAVIGAGNLGSTIAYEVANRGIADEIILIDIVKELAEGQASDIEQAIAHRNNTRIRSGDYHELKNAAVVVITAGKPRTPDTKSRLELASTNAKIIKDVAEKIKTSGFDGMIITLTNPMDVMNYIVSQKMYDRKSVIGSGGQLDGARFRVVLSKMYHAHSSSIEAYVIGEHGDSQVPIFSDVKINRRKKSFTEEEKKKILTELKNAAWNVLNKKGATVFAPANNTVDMIEAILNDEKPTMMCSVTLRGEYGLSNVSIGVPVTLGRNGADILEWELDEEELAALQKSAEGLKKFLGEMGE